jgi:hypothetical protein
VVSSAEKEARLALEALTAAEEAAAKVPAEGADCGGSIVRVFAYTDRRNREKAKSRGLGMIGESIGRPGHLGEVMSWVTEAPVGVRDLLVAVASVTECLALSKQEETFQHNPEMMRKLVAVDNLTKIIAGRVVGLTNITAEPSNNVTPEQTKCNYDNLRLCMDLSDKLEQGYLKGKFVLTSVVRENQERLFPVEDNEKADQAVKVVVDMVKRKLGVDIAPINLGTCHYTQSGAIIFRMGDLKYGSTYDNMVRAIKSGKNREVNVYFNSMLTRRRTNLLYYVCLAKRAGNIHWFYSVAARYITIVHNKHDSRTRLTDFYTADTKNYSTMTVDELEAKYARQSGLGYEVTHDPTIIPKKKFHWKV